MGQRLEPMVSLWEIDFRKLHAEMDFLLFGHQNQRNNNFLLPTRSRVSCFCSFTSLLFASTKKTCPIRVVHILLGAWRSEREMGSTFFQVTIQNMHRHRSTTVCAMNSWGTTRRTLLLAVIPTMQGEVCLLNGWLSIAGESWECEEPNELWWCLFVRPRIASHAAGWAHYQIYPPTQQNLDNSSTRCWPSNPMQS